jgi:acyl dehydratase
MTVAPRVAEDIKNRIGVTYPPLVYDVEKGMIERFARAVGDTNPLWETKGNKAVAPPTLPLILGFDLMIQELNRDSSLTVLHGSTDLECHRSIVPGDTLTVTPVITGVRERDGEKGKTLFVSFETTCRNQRQETVAVCRQMAIIY